MRCDGNFWVKKQSFFLKKKFTTYLWIWTLTKLYGGLIKPKTRFQLLDFVFGGCSHIVRYSSIEKFKRRRRRMFFYVLPLLHLPSIEHTMHCLNLLPIQLVHSTKPDPPRGTPNVTNQMHGVHGAYLYSYGVDLHMSDRWADVVWLHFPLAHHDDLHYESKERPWQEQHV